VENILYFCTSAKQKTEVKTQMKTQYIEPLVVRISLTDENHILTGSKGGEKNEEETIKMNNNPGDDHKGAFPQAKPFGRWEPDWNEP
jgi:hypothetical protein